MLSKLINNNSFEMDTIVYNNTMLEGIEKEEIDYLIKTYNGDIFTHSKNSNIVFPSKVDNTLYDITYIDKNGYMHSEIDLNIYELSIFVSTLENKVREGDINLFKSSNRIKIK